MTEKITASADEIYSLSVSLLVRLSAMLFRDPSCHVNFPEVNKEWGGVLKR